MITDALFHPSVLGVYLGRKQVVYAHSTRTLRAPRRIEKSGRLEFEQPFAGLERDIDADTVERQLAKLRDCCDVQGSAVQVALPNPFVRFFSITREGRVKRKDIRSVIEWHLERIGEASADSYQIAWQLVPLQDGNAQIFGQAMEKSLYNAIVRGVQQSSGILTVVDAATNFRWNRLPEATKSTPAAVLEVMEDHWTFRAWTGNGMPTVTKSRWRLDGESEELNGIVREIHRLLVSDADVSGIRHPQRLYVSAQADELASLGRSLELFLPNLTWSVFPGQQEREHLQHDHDSNIAMLVAKEAAWPRG